MNPNIHITLESSWVGYPWGGKLRLSRLMRAGSFSLPKKGTAFELSPLKSGLEFPFPPFILGIGVLGFGLPGIGLLGIGLLGLFCRLSVGLKKS